jgi:hypothetical protein
LARSQSCSCRTRSVLTWLLILLSTQKIERSRTAITNNKNWTDIFPFRAADVKAFYSPGEGHVSDDRHSAASYRLTMHAERLKGTRPLRSKLLERNPHGRSSPRGQPQPDQFRQHRCCQCSLRLGGPWNQRSEFREQGWTVGQRQTRQSAENDFALSRALRIFSAYVLPRTLVKLWDIIEPTARSRPCCYRRNTDSLFGAALRRSAPPLNAFRFSTLDTFARSGKR